MLDWYDRNRRDLPWRAKPGTQADPYHVWLSEVMLQQTTVATVAPYFAKFLARWPRIEDLAAAPLEAVLDQWAGLGYYARARNLHKTAQAVASRHRGRFPRTVEGLAALPGIGPYTAAAVAAIAFDAPAAPVDGNIERVLTRLFAIDTPLPAAKGELRALAQSLCPPARSGDYAQALMDLGSGICTPRKPACVLCPLNVLCQARRAGDPEIYPRKAAKAPRPHRYGVAYWLQRGDGMVLLVRRPESGLLGGMLALPTGDWTAEPPDAASIKAAAPLPAHWQGLEGEVRHVFTHFELHLTVQAAAIRLGDPRLGHWTDPARLDEAGLPTLFAKAARHARRQIR